jgi:hypothetical protein
MRRRGIAVLLLLAGCAGGFGGTRKRWDSRIGSFSYAQALEEIGVPDEQIITSSGGWVAIWHGRRTRGAVLASLGGSGLSFPPKSSARSEALRLTFTEEGSLLDWGNP